MKYIILISFLFFIPISQAEAGVYVEPYGDIGGSISSGDFFPTIGGGLQTGYSFLAFKAGLDIFFNHHLIGNTNLRTLYVNYEDSNVRGFNQAGESFSPQYSNSANSFTPLSIGIYGAIDLPFLIDAYGTIFYSTGSKAKVKQEGFGVKVGMSYLAALFLQLNVGLQAALYDCKDANDPACKKSFKIYSAFISVSAPIPLGKFFNSDRELDSTESEEEETSNSQSSEDDEEIIM